MASIEDQLKNVRTMEDVVNLLTILFTNLNNQNEMYYDMFINPEPMDLELERYDENGKLVTVTLANRAKDRIITYSGQGSPQGVLTAAPGSFYLDITSKDMYYKAYGMDANGWTLFCSENSIQSFSGNFLTPTGNAVNLTNLNMDNVGTGTLKVEFGGTGSNSLSGILKGNGTGPVTSAEAGVDYMLPSDMTGIVAFYPVATVPSGWLICNGQEVSRVTYSRLFSKIGTVYGEGDGSTTFNLPNLIDRYIKGGTTDIGTYGAGAVASHKHEFAGETNSEESHTHGKGSFRIEGAFSGVGQYYSNTSHSGGATLEGPFYRKNTANEPKEGVVLHNKGQREDFFGFDTDRDGGACWTGITSSGSAHKHAYSGETAANAGGQKNEVDHIVMVPVIKY